MQHTLYYIFSPPRGRVTLQQVGTHDLEQLVTANWLASWATLDSFRGADTEFSLEPLKKKYS